MFRPKQVLFTIAAFVAVVKAHFSLTYPPTRGFVEDTETKAPCGGFDSVGPRSTFPLGDAYVVLDSEHATATITVLISFSQNPTGFADWIKPPLRDFFQTTSSSICIGVDIKSLNYTDAKDGANATILVQYSGGDGDLYQCTDVTLSSSFKIPSNVTCTDKIAIPPTTSTSAATASGSSQAPASSQTATAPGTTVWGGSMVALLLTFGALAFA